MLALLINAPCVIFPKRTKPLHAQILLSFKVAASLLDARETIVASMNRHRRASLQAIALHEIVIHFKLKILALMPRTLILVNILVIPLENIGIC